MSKFGVFLMFVCFRVSQVLPSAIQIDNQSQGQFLKVDEEFTACKEEFSWVGDQCYYFSNTGASFDDAHNKCNSLGAELAHPNSEEENSKLTRYLRNMGDHSRDYRVWRIGATNRYSEGEWVWAHDKRPVGYTDWFSEDMLNDRYPNENCAVLHWRLKQYRWFDTSCEFNFYYICQYPHLNDNTVEEVTEVITSTTTTTAAAIHASKSDFIQLGEHSYYFSTTTATFDQASEACQSIGTRLAHPRNSLENSKLTWHILLYKTNAIGWWIGATDRDDEGQWVWAHDNRPVGYADWLGGEPSNEFTIEDCAHLRKYVIYKWKDTPCNNKFNFICQSENLKYDSQKLSSSAEDLEGKCPMNDTF